MDQLNSGYVGKVNSGFFPTQILAGSRHSLPYPHHSSSTPGCSWLSAVAAELVEEPGGSCGRADRAPSPRPLLPAAGRAAPSRVRAEQPGQKNAFPCGDPSDEVWVGAVGFGERAWRVVQHGRPRHRPKELLPLLPSPRTSQLTFYADTDTRQTCTHTVHEERARRTNTWHESLYKGAERIRTGSSPSPALPSSRSRGA